MIEWHRRIELSGVKILIVVSWVRWVGRVEMRDEQWEGGGAGAPQNKNPGKGEKPKVLGGNWQTLQKILQVAKDCQDWPFCIESPRPKNF